MMSSIGSAINRLLVTSYRWLTPHALLGNGDTTIVGAHTRVPGDLIVSVLRRLAHFGVQSCDQAAERFDPQPIRVTEVKPVEELVAGHPEQVVHRHRHPRFGQHRMP